MRLVLPIIPENRCSRWPLPAHLNVDVLLIHVEQIPKNEITLGFIKTDNSISHRPVNPECLPACGRMHSNERVNPLDELWPRFWVLAV